MLKIMKNDVIAYKKFGIIYLIMTLLIVLNIVSINFIPKSFEIGIPLSILLFYFMVMAFGFIVFGFEIYYAYKTTFSNHAYINFKLGISRNKVIISRMLNLLILNIISILLEIVLASLFINALTGSSNNGVISLIENLFNAPLPPELSSLSMHWIFTFYVLFIIVTLISGIVKIFLALALGHMANKNKKILSFLSYIGIGIVEGIFSGIAMIVYMVSSVQNFISDKVNGLPTFIYSSLGVMTTLWIIFIIVEIFLLFKIINKKLNI